MTSGSDGIRSIQRALQILEHLSRNPDGLALSALAARLELPASTCHRILSTLEAAGFAHRWAERGKYSLGYRLCELASQSATLDTLVLSVARDAMEQLNGQLGETCNLARREGLVARYIFQVAPRTAVRLFTAVGSAVPLYSTGVGKVLLTDAPEAVVASVVQHMPALTPTTITDAAALRLEIDRIRQRGYAIDNEEHQEGVMCVAVPIHDFTGAIHASLSTAGPTTRIARSLAKVIPATQAAAAEISRLLGQEQQRVSTPWLPETRIDPTPGEAGEGLAPQSCAGEAEPQAETSVDLGGLAGKRIGRGSRRHRNTPRSTA
jgi:IclR family KDG regulon transcriptional repressor